MVARTLPGKQFEVGRTLRALVVFALRAGQASRRRADRPAASTLSVLVKVDELPDRMAIGKLIHAVVDLVEGDCR